MDTALASRIVDVVASFPEVAATWVFGSVARGEAGPDSDLDVAVLPGAVPFSLDRQLALAARLEAACDRRVDLVLLSLRDLVLCYEVLNGGVLVHESDRERRIDFASDAIVRSIDFMPTWRIANDGWIEGWRRSVRELR